LTLKFIPTPLNFNPNDIECIIRNVLAKTGQTAPSGGAIPAAARAAVLVGKERL